MAGPGTGAGTTHVVNVYHEKSRILPDVSRVLACLYEKDVKFQTFRASYKDLLSLQASRSVPVPFYDGTVFLQDSRAICRYIAETYEHQGYRFLLGKDVLERASIEQWLRHEEHAFDPPSRALFCHLAFPPKHEDEDDRNAINQETRKLEEVLEVYEQRLCETEFLAGNKFTLADLVHLPGTHHVITSERFAYLYDSRKNVQRWWNNISSRDSWQQVLRDMENVEEQHELEERQEQQQWPLPPVGGREIRIDPRKEQGTTPQTVLVGPPSTGAVTTFVTPTPQEDHGTTSDDQKKPSSSPNQTKQGGFFTPPEKHPPPPKKKESTIGSGSSTKSSFFTSPSTPTTAKTPQKTDDDKPSSKTDTSPIATSQQRSPKTKVPDEAGSLAKPSSQDSSKISPESEPDHSGKTEKKPTPSKYTTPDTQKTQTPYIKPSEERGTDTSDGPAEPSQKLKSDVPTASTPSKGDTPPDVIIDDERRFSTMRLREEMFNPDIKDSQHPSKQEEVPADREKQTTVIPESGKSGGSPSPDTRTPAYAPISDEGRSAILPPEGEMATGGAEKSPFDQQVPPVGPSTDKLANTDGVNTGAPQGTAPNTPAYPSSTTVSGDDEQPEKPSREDEMALETTTRKIPPADRRSASAPVEEDTPDGHVKQGTAGRGGIQDVQDIGGAKKIIVDKRAAELSSQQTSDAIKGVITAKESTKAAPPEPVQAPSSRGDTPKKPVVGKTAAESSSQQTKEPMKGVGPTLQGIRGDESTKAAPTGPVEEPAFGEQSMPTVHHGGTAESNGKEGVKTSTGDPRGTLPTTQGRLAPAPATQLPTASGKMSDQSPDLPLAYTRNEKTEIAETSQTSTAAPNEKPGERVLRNARESSSGSSPMKSQEEQDDQSGGKLVENRMRQGDDVGQNARTGKLSKEEDYIANANNNNNRKAQATTIDAPSKLQIPSGKNKSETSKDGDKGINETANSRNSETSRNVQPSFSEKSMGQKQLQEIGSTTSLQDNGKSSNAPPLRSRTEQQNKDDLPTEDDMNNKKSQREANYEEKTSSDTQQDK